MHVLKRMIEILDDKSASLSKGSAATARTWAEYSTRDVAQFWLLHTVSSALAPLREMYTGRHAHPERLFVQMLRLAGALCTFAMESHPRDLPQLGVTIPAATLERFWAMLAHYHGQVWHGAELARAFAIALLTGLVEPVGGLLGAVAVGMASVLLPWGLGCAAGAMLFVISNEIIPETHRRGHQAAVTFALLAGFGFMMALDQMLG